MKAIHNIRERIKNVRKVVYDPAKLVKMKEIHNWAATPTNLLRVVYDPAKLVNMKEIHNSFHLPFGNGKVVYDPAKVIILKAIHNYTINAFISHFTDNCLCLCKVNNYIKKFCSLIKKKYVCNEIINQSII